MKNAIRFWHYADGGPVLIKIKAGQVLNHVTGGRTDEGWQSDAHRWEFDGQFLRHEQVSDGCDCDGRLTRAYESECHASQVAAGNDDPDATGITYPAWRDVDASQRDYAAEAMGY